MNISLKSTRNRTQKKHQNQNKFFIKIIPILSINFMEVVFLNYSITIPKEVRRANTSGVENLALSSLFEDGSIE